MKISPTLEKKLRTVFQKYGIIAAYLFGSQIQGKTHPHSDIDIAVRFSRELSLKKTLELIHELSHILKKFVDLVDLEKASIPLQFRVYKARSLLYAKNPKTEFMERSKILSLYYDSRYYSQRFIHTEMNRILTQGLI